MPNPTAKAVDEAFGRVLARIRREREFSQEGLGNASGSGRTYVSELERGKRGASLKTVFRLAEHLETPPSDIVKMVEDELRKGRR